MKPIPKVDWPRTFWDLAGCALIIGSTVAAGLVIGFGAALGVLALSSGDARGSEMLVIGFSALAGAAIGLAAGIVGAIYWLAAKRGIDRRPS